MENALVLTPVEQHEIDTIINNGPSSNSGYNAEMVASALLKVGVETYTQAMKVIEEDSQLRKDIVTKLSTAVNSTLRSNDETIQKAIDNNVENSNVIRAFMDNHELSAEEFRACMDELRTYSQDINRLAAALKDANVQVMSEQQQTANKAMKKSSLGRDLAIGFGGFTVGTIITAIIFNKFNRK